MKAISLFILAASCFLACGSNGPDNDNQETSIPLPPALVSKQDTTINFERDDINNAPAGFTATYTGGKQTLKWEVVNESGNKVAAQLASNEGSHFNLLVLEKPGYKNLRMSVRIKAVSGSEDQGGGVVWRYIDNNNYYVARYNPLENNLRFYRVANGDRRQLEGASVEIPSNTWFTLSVEMIEDKVSCYINGSKLIDSKDATFSKAGRIGLWTKADAVTYFDELTILPME